MDGSVARPRPFAALGLRLLSALTLSTMAMLVKLANSRGVHLFELIFWRQALTFLLLGGGMLALGKIAMVRTRRFGAHFKRATWGIAGMCFVYGTIVLLPLAEATTLHFTAPIFAVLLAVILFGEKVGRYRWAAVLLGFAGVLVVAQPGAGGPIDLRGVAVGLTAGLLVAFLSYQIQDLNKTETPWSIVFWFSALSLPLAAAALPFVGQTHDMGSWLIIAAMGLAGAIGQIFLTASLRYGSAASVIIMDYSALIWATIYGWLIFDRVPASSLWLGAPLIVVAGALITWREHVLAKQERLRAREASGT